MRTLVCIVGPTASGKSAVADEVAVRLSSSVISVDAMQVYRGMDIGINAPTVVFFSTLPIQTSSGVLKTAFSTSAAS